MSWHARASIVFALTVLPIFTVSAQCSGVMCAAVHIEQLYVDAGTVNSGDIWIQTSGTETNLSCTANSGVFVKIPAAAPEKKQLFALLMMAYAMDKPVAIRVEENSVDCRVVYAYLNR
jgi:hypothetical protein